MQIQLRVNHWHCHSENGCWWWWRLHFVFCGTMEYQPPCHYFFNTCMRLSRLSKLDLMLPMFSLKLAWSCKQNKDWLVSSLLCIPEHLGYVCICHLWWNSLGKTKGLGPLKLLLLQSTRNTSKLCIWDISVTLSYAKFVLKIPLQEGSTKKSKMPAPRHTDKGAHIHTSQHSAVEPLSQDQCQKTKSSTSGQKRRVVSRLLA